MGIAEARAKLLLFGEHSAVYGSPAVGVSLPWTLTVHHIRGPVWDLPGLGPYEAAVRTVVSRLEELALEQGLPRPAPGRLDFQSEIPVSSGFGSSGALCAALVNLFWPELPLGHRDLLAWKAEGQFHGTPSGIDTALALRQGWWALDPSVRPVSAEALPDPGLVLVVGALVREGDTKSLVGSLARRREAGDPVVLSALEGLGTVSGQATNALKAGRSDEIPALALRAREGLKRLDLETSALSQVLDEGLKRPGALAGKLSGAGNGGAFFLVFQDRASAQEALPMVFAAAPPGQWTCRPTLV